MNVFSTFSFFYIFRNKRAFTFFSFYTFATPMLLNLENIKRLCDQTKSMFTSPKWLKKLICTFNTKTHMQITQAYAGLYTKTPGHSYWYFQFKVPAIIAGTLLNSCCACPELVLYKCLVILHTIHYKPMKHKNIVTLTGKR